MSLSNSPTDTSSWGTIFMGPERIRETTLSRIDTRQKGPIWNESTEAEYFERIKAKATEKASKLLAGARAEAETIRQAAQQEGYEQGIAAARNEFDEFRMAAGQTAAAVLSAIEAQSDAITKAWKKELCNLVRLSVEAGIGYELKGHRVEILAALFRDAVSSIASQQTALVFVNPEDEPVIADIIASAGDEYVRRFQVRSNPQLSPGSIVLESSLGLVENTMEARRTMIDNILKELDLKEDMEPKSFARDSIEASVEPQTEMLSQPDESSVDRHIEQEADSRQEFANHSEKSLQDDSLRSEAQMPEDTSSAPSAMELADKGSELNPNDLDLADQEEKYQEETLETTGSLIPQNLLEAAALATNGQSPESVNSAGTNTTQDAKAEADNATEQTQAESSQIEADELLASYFDDSNK